MIKQALLLWKWRADDGTKPLTRLEMPIVRGGLKSHGCFSWFEARQWVVAFPAVLVFGDPVLVIAPALPDAGADAVVFVVPVISEDALAEKVRLIPPSRTQLVITAPMTSMITSAINR